MIFEINRSLALLSIVALLSACGGGSEDTTSNVYDGAWKPSPICKSSTYTDPVTKEVINESTKASLVIKGASATYDITEYPNSLDCTGASEHIKIDSSLAYGAFVADASSVCSNTRKIDTAITSMTIKGVTLSAEALATFLADDDTPRSVSYGLICTSPDGTKLYFGDDGGNKPGNSDATRPIFIDSTSYLEKQ